ncbi:TetR/AcrR family transcriptional regulator [Dactylosporangium fulvum]|uniref:TetR/AcrR family transcriptional regulator n=1 Tax=Dactylosporangium fulvum TaxID=53359 RepID=A0ABY5VQE0_9ACTN|nr:TetR/AcrR family transcriptional regulator [Dactylosporangium fulvum]UWP78703.1 TetR/AcrR family transcriptional regulator [Dactylosporangium fulvum]
MGTADRLVESTRELLWERGYTATSPRAIQERAGAGQGSMYHHFRGKPDLAAEAIRRTAAELRTAAEASLNGPGDAVERITAYLHRSRDVLKGCPIGRLAQDPGIVDDPVLREPLDTTFTWLRGRLAELLAEDVPAVDAGATAATIVATLQGGYVLARAAGSTEPFEQAVAGVLGLLSLATGKA